MVFIRKNREPGVLTEYRKTPGSSYPDMPQAVKKVVRDSLLKEQGYLCAYCMRSIRMPERMTIEHYLPQHPADDAADPKSALDYKNLLAVCKNGSGADKVTRSKLTCGEHKENQTLTVDPLSREKMDMIYYSHSGHIRSYHPEINHDLNEVLNLNCSAVSLPESRRGALKALNGVLKKKKGQGDWSKAMLEQYIRKCEGEPGGELTEYVGILRWYLKQQMAKNM